MNTDHDGLPSLGRELRRLRESSGMTQAETARIVGLSARSAVADYESGRRVPPDDIVRNYERAFDITQGTLRLQRVQVRAARRQQRSPDVRPAAPVDIPPSMSRRREAPWRVLATVLVLVGSFAVLSGSADATSGVLGFDPTWTQSTQNVTDRALTNTPPEPMDGDDPRARDCYADAIVVRTAPMYLPDGQFFGTLRLRHSNRCGTSWGSAYYSNPNLYTIRITVGRPSDDAVVHDDWSDNTPPGSYSDMLSTGRGCVWVQAVVITPTGTSAPAKTQCV